LFSQDRIPELRQVSFPEVFISIDPNGAGKTSDLGVISFVRRGGQCTLVGAESFPSRTGLENHNLILNHANHLRSKYPFRESTLVFIIESNLGNEAEFMAAMIKDNLGQFVVMQENDKRIGFLTTNAVKNKAVEHVRESIGSGGVFIAAPGWFISVSKPYDVVLGQFHKQLSDFVEVIQDKDFKKPTRLFTGKRQNQKDDMVLAFILGLYWGLKWYSDRYRSYIR
jgi:hypothetical protein